MAYDEGLAERLREAFEDEPGVAEKKMFGGLCFLVGGNMCCGIVGDELMVRVGPDGYADALAQPHAREMDFTGRPLKGMVYVACGGFEADEDLAAWVARGRGFAASLPAKSQKAAARAKPKAAATKSVAMKAAPKARLLAKKKAAKKKAGKR